MKLAPAFNAVIFSAVLCGTLFSPTFADEPVVPTVPTADAPIAPTADAAPAVQKQYIFEPKEVPAPGGGTTVYVRLSDSFDPSFHRRVLFILDDAGKYTRTQRAKVVATRLQKACNADPNFVDTILPPQSLGSEIVLKLKSQASQPDGFIITADRDSMRSANASTREQYAQMIITAIQDRLKGIKFRDAAFDYQLNAEQRMQRASEYFEQAHTAYENKDPDVAISKCELALRLQPDYNYCRLLLADLYAETKQNDKARRMYQLVKTQDGNAADKKTASDRLKRLSSS